MRLVYQLSRLIQATHPQPPNPLKQVEQYMYDAVGNRIDVANVYNAGNQLTEDANYVYSYDKNGNTISKIDKVSGKYTHYYWDAENKLVRVQDYTNIASATPVAVNKYIYDGYGRRVAKNVNGSITKYVYDRKNILFETDKDDNILARYTHGSRIDEPLIMDRGGQSYYYVVDGLGSVVKIINASGNMVNDYAYDVFGNIMERTEGVPNMFTYTAREYDKELDLYYYRKRYYDAKTGRFISEDPIGFMGGMNFYSYVNNNPVTYVDPWGLKRCCNKNWSNCYINCVNYFDPIGNLAGRLTTSLLVRFMQDTIYEFPWDEGALEVVTSVFKTSDKGLILLAGWSAGTSYGCMFSCATDSCNY